MARRTPAPKPAVETPVVDEVVETPTDAPADDVVESTATVTVTPGDPAAAAAAAREKAEKDLAARLRSDRVAALKIEREGLTRVPNPNTRRIAEVDAELARYAGKPARRGAAETR